MSTKKPILVIDDDEMILELMQDVLRHQNLEAIVADNGLEGIRKFSEYEPDIVFLDFKMPHMDGIETMENIIKIDPAAYVIIFTSHADVDTAVEAMKKGAYDYIIKPVDLKKISLIVDRIKRSKTLHEEKTVLQNRLDQLFGKSNFIGVSTQIQQIAEQIDQVSGTDSTVLITGESGTGKELVANALHYSSKRKTKKFVKVNCAALAETVIESELFGHEKGAFTSAITRRIGRFELANEGTIFLDEIGEIPLSTQVKLLRVLENHEFERLGGNDTIKVDIRVIAATNRNLEKLVDQGKFREDLFYRLNVINIHLPPLRERKKDIPVLADHFLKKFATEMNKPLQKFSRRALQILESYAWPGNVRELVNTIERSVVFCKGKILTEKDLPYNFGSNGKSGKISLQLSSYSLTDAEKILIQKTLQETKGNLKRAAELLKISRGTLYSKLEKLNIPRP
ncbi:MAG: sigma-54-dependent Fis family transcriptional regulator [Calditrichaeota bacterium]|nr:sigma-54-dependent Fis family transcriptional regulator [Calditrichota bacterium]